MANTRECFPRWTWVIIAIFFFVMMFMCFSSMIFGGYWGETGYGWHHRGSYYYRNTNQSEITELKQSIDELKLEIQKLKENQ